MKMPGEAPCKREKMPSGLRKATIYTKFAPDTPAWARFANASPSSALPGTSSAKLYTYIPAMAKPAPPEIEKRPGDAFAQELLPLRAALPTAYWQQIGYSAQEVPENEKHYTFWLPEGGNTLVLQKLLSKPRQEHLEMLASAPLPLLQAQVAKRRLELLTLGLQIFRSSVLFCAYLDGFAETLVKHLAKEGLILGYEKWEIFPIQATATSAPRIVADARYHQSFPEILGFNFSHFYSLLRWARSIRKLEVLPLQEAPTFAQNRFGPSLSEDAFAPVDCNASIWVPLNAEAGLLLGN